MFKKDLGDALLQIFGMKKVTFSHPSEGSFEQDTLFIDISKCTSRTGYGKAYAKAEGSITVFSQQEKFPFGYLNKRIQQADPELRKDLFFFDIDQDIASSPARIQNISERRTSFIYLWEGEYDPNQGELTSLELSIDTTVVAPVATSLHFAIQPQTSIGGAIMPLIRVWIMDQYGNPFSTGDDEITLSIITNPAGGVLSGITTVTAVGGVADFDTVSINMGGEGYKLLAEASGLESVTSRAFDIQNVGTYLSIEDEPTGGVALEILDPIQIVIRDQNGTHMEFATNVVTVTIGENPEGGTLDGTLTVAAIGGVATFSDLSINTGGEGYTLIFSSAGLSSVESDPFDIINIPTSLQFFVQPQDMFETGTMDPITVRVLDQLGNFLPSATNTIALAITTNPGGGVLSGTVSKAAVAGVAIFDDLAISNDGNGYVLTASSAGLVSEDSDPFDIDPLAATSLEFVVQPSSEIAGDSISPSITVRILDQLGNPFSATNNITLAIGTNPSSGVIAGTLTQAAVAGVATFNDISLDRAGVGYTLTASAAGLSGDTSDAFTITGLNLEVPIEMVPFGLWSLSASTTTFLRTKTSLDTSYYNGTLSYFWEIVVTNTNVSTAYSAELLDAASNVITSISVPASTTSTRIRQAFTPTAGAEVYHIKLPQTASNFNLQILSARMIVKQVGAGKTRLNIPLISKNEGSGVQTDSGSGGVTELIATATYNFGFGMTLITPTFADWATISSGTPWTFESVHSTNDAAETATVGLYNETAGAIVTGSEIAVTGDTNVHWNQASFASNATNWTDGHTYRARGKISNTSFRCVMNKASLWVNLNSLTKAKIFHMVHKMLLAVTPVGTNKILYTAGNYSNPVVKFEGTGSVTASTLSVDLTDIGTSDSATTGSNVASSTLTFNTVASRQRSGALTLTDGNRFIGSIVNNGAGSVRMCGMYVLVDIS